MRRALRMSAEIARAIDVVLRVVREGIHRDRVRSVRSLQTAMGEKEFAGIVIITEVAMKRRATHSNFDILANLEMEMRVVHTVRGPDRRQLLPAHNTLPGAHEN